MTANPFSWRKHAQRRQVTVMFCDMVGSSALSAGMEPEDFCALLVAYRRMVTALVERWGGLVSRYVGDGVLACWGYPQAGGDDARRALGAAIAIREAFGDSLLGKGVRVRIGIDCGVLVVGDLGAGPTQAIDLVGDAANIAAHLQASASSGDILVTRALRDAAAKGFEFAAGGRRKVKSRRAPIPVFRVIRHAHGAIDDRPASRPTFAGLIARGVAGAIAG